MKNDIEILLKNNNYLNNYVHNKSNQSNFYENKYSIVGGSKDVKNNKF